GQRRLTFNFHPPNMRPSNLPTIYCITETDIDLNDLLAKITLPSTGAAAIFTGMVRGITPRGDARETEYLEYEAYIPMAEAKMKQVAEEILGVLNLTEQILSDFGFRDYEVNLSTRPEKSVGSDEVWELATKALRNALDTKGWTYKEDVGGGAFYGPKIDIKIRDAIGRLWQCSTVQVDFNLPQRFGLEYVAADGSRQTPIMIHRAIFGSLERFFGILIEHYAGDFPLWLAPVQLRFLPVAEQYVAYAQNLATDWQKLGLRVEVDRSGERLGKLIRNAETAKIPVMAIVGAKEQQSSTLSIRTRHGGDLGALSIAEVQERLMQAVQQRRDF
ncbi:MAG: His/Gly/Thr/Pro-type tRNA ligase C-terminal domain-containing protein, partial [Gloeomargarita sp. GMQP_bins_69]